MKYLFLICIYLNCFVAVQSQTSAILNTYISPKGFSNDGFKTYCLKGGGSPYLVYNEPSFNINEPVGFPLKREIPYHDLLISSLKSLLFEYKNYQGQQNLSAYSVFALGNFSIISDKMLSLINKYILTNQTLLRQIYSWAKPNYEKIFNALTVEEQMVLLQHLDVAEKYISLVLKNHDEIKYREWLLDHNIQADEKLTGFLQRRVNKRQWTVEDCNYWVMGLKKDFSCHIKDAQLTSSHYQIVDTINTQYMITTNHIGNYFIMDKDYKKLYSNPYIFIEKRDFNILRGHRNYYSNNYEQYSVGQQRIDPVPVINDFLINRNNY